MWVNNGKMIIEANAISRDKNKVIVRNMNAELVEEYGTEEEAAEVLKDVYVALEYSIGAYTLPKRKDAGLHS